jgi:flagellar protein FliO/FliZ
MDTALLGLRVALSLACVLGLIWFAGRRLQGSATVRKQRSVPMTVLGRQSLGKGAGIALVEVAGRVLLLGVGDQGVRLLTEVVPDAVPAQSPDPAASSGAERSAAAGTGSEVREEIDLALVAATDREVLVAVPDDAAPVALAGVGQPGVLHGSALSPDTWRRAVDVVQRRTARR